jgi:hypothetical protein
MKQSLWYAMWEKNGRFVVAVIVGSPDNQPTTIGSWATEQRAAYACLRHSRMARVEGPRKGRAKARGAKAKVPAWKRHQTVADLLDRMRAASMAQAAAAQKDSRRGAAARAMLGL